MTPLSLPALQVNQKWGLHPRRSSLHLLAVPCAVFTLSACGDPLKYPQDLQEVRVLGVQIDTPAGTSFPKPEQTAMVSLLVAGPQGPALGRAAYQVCEALDATRGVPLCAESPLASGVTSKTTSPFFQFEGEEVSADDQRYAILGVFCESGDPLLAEDPKDWSCSDDSPARRWSLEMDPKSAENKNPDLSSTLIEYEDGDGKLDEVVADEASALPSCEAAPEIPAGQTIFVHISLDEASREPDLDEVLQLSHYSTLGRFERQYTILDPDEALEFDLEFEVPEEVGPIKSYLVVRDNRGGTAWVTWSACVVNK